MTARCAPPRVRVRRARRVLGLDEIVGAQTIDVRRSRAPMRADA
ncbi:hypothetical protein A7982_12329 [Minicystis rosea]|nr:hypothetical protein A7982_12329 [Minicystis rosea]